MLQENDTIVAISTAAGQGGIGIVRLSGPGALGIAEAMLRLKAPMVPGRVRYGAVLDLTTGQAQAPVLDEAVATYFAAPHSYTAEDVVEIAVHGAPVLLEAIVRQATGLGARLAEAGEFTQRAFLNGRLDLTQAEAVHDLVAATTLEQARLAARQLGGAVSQQVRPLKQQLVELIAALEAGIDFVDDDLDLLPQAAILEQLAALAGPLAVLEQSFGYGRLVREGLSLALVGRPNAGKSSLFNRLIRRDRAIVTAQPGTTRDPIVEQMNFQGIPVQLVDTAGLRRSVDEAERLGISKSREAMAQADVVLLVISLEAGERPEDGRPEGMHPDDVEALQSVAPAGQERHAAVIVVLNKIDLAAHAGEVEDREAAVRAHARRVGLAVPVVVRSSAIMAEGVAALEQALVDLLRAVPANADTAIITNLRQHEALAEALKAVIDGRRAVLDATPHEMLLLDLYAALQALDSLTGTTSTEDVLRLIFSTFCIGK